MTDRSKSQRKRRLQLNAEEFAPPADMYEASEEPRLDETWMQFYGGERQIVKRLTALEDELPPVNTNSAAPPQSPSPTDVSPSTLTPANSLTSPLLTEANNLTPPTEEPHAERSPRPVLSSVRRLSNQEETAPRDKRTEHLSRVLAPPATKQVADFKEVIAPEPLSEEVSLPDKSDPALPSFEEWSRRWSPWLKRGGSIKVCEAFFRLTHERGSAECFTSNSEIMKLTDLSRAQCIRNIHYLIEIGFLDELDEVNNREAKGTYYRFNLVPTSLAASQP